MSASPKLSCSFYQVYHVSHMELPYSLQIQVQFFETGWIDHPLNLSLKSLFLVPFEWFQRPDRCVYSEMTQQDGLVVDGPPPRSGSSYGAFLREKGFVTLKGKCIGISVLPLEVDQQPPITEQRDLETLFEFKVSLYLVRGAFLRVFVCYQAELFAKL